MLLPAVVPLFIRIRLFMHIRLFMLSRLFRLTGLLRLIFALTFAFLLMVLLGIILACIVPQSSGIAALAGLMQDFGTAPLDVSRHADGHKDLARSSV